MSRSVQSVAILALMIVAARLGAQTVPSVRPLGPVIRVSAANLLGSVSSGIGASFLFADLAVIWSEILHMKLSISFFEGMMVTMGCVTVLPPVLVVPDPPPSGGGSGDGEELCYYLYRLWESADGGLTFYLVAESITIAPC